VQQRIGAVKKRLLAPKHYGLHGDLRQCITCGVRMCDCSSAGLAYQIFYCIHCGETEVEEQECNSTLAA